MEGFLWSAFIFFAAAVLAVPISKKLGFGSVLGYLIAGFLIGPSGLRLITNVEDILHFSEFGVVLLLFLIGIELELRKLWQMRYSIFGLGGLQVVACLAVFALLASFLFSWPVALLVGMSFSLSSTAMVLQLLNERKSLHSPGGRSAFAVLLFQDIAVIPMLALLPLLAPSTGVTDPLLKLLHFGKIVGILVLVFVIGRLFLRHIFRMIANVRMRELFTALALLLVVGMALLMESFELSMGLGAFLAGLLLADSEYRHAIEADIEPFKGLLLGLFFISIGMSVRSSDILQNPALIASAVVVIILLKTALHYLVGWIFRVPRTQLPFFSLALAQVGEFAFVLFGTALSLGILTEEERGPLVAVSALSFVGVSLAVKAYDYFLASRLEKGSPREADEVVSSGAPVIIAGFGRVGQIVGRYLFANGIKATVLDFEADQVELLRKFGFKIFYGDATRLDLIEAAGAENAKILVVAIDDVEASLALVDLAQKHFPHLTLICRARNVNHVFELKARGVHLLEREAFDGSLRLGRLVLEQLGMPRYQAHSLAQKFRDFDHSMVDRMARDRDSDGARISQAQQARVDIERMFAEEDKRIRQGDEGWDGYQEAP